MILNLIFLAAALLSGCGIWWGTEIHAAWLLLLLPGMYVAAVILFFAGLFVISRFFPKDGPKVGSRGAQVVIRLAMSWLMQMMRVRIHMEGEELLPEEPCVIVGNHRSDFDPMTVLAVLRGRKLIYISKEGNFKIPLVGPFIRQAGFLAIDRENGMRAMRTLKRAADRLRNESVDVGIYPEGTRSRTGELLEFKTGAFYLAKKAEAPIVVMVASGTEEISSHFPWRSTRVSLRFTERIDKETVAASSMEELAAMTRAVVERELAAK